MIVQHPTIPNYRVEIPAKNKQRWLAKGWRSEDKPSAPAGRSKGTTASKPTPQAEPPVEATPDGIETPSPATDEA